MRRLLIPSTISCLAIIAILLYAMNQFDIRLRYKQNTIEYLAQEIRWLRFSEERANEKIKELPKLEWLVQNFRSNDQNVCTVAEAAWKWGRIYNVSPFLIMSVAHRESNFNPLAISYVNGSPCAYGVMQINAAVWKPDMDKIFDIDYNVMIGTKILRHYLDMANGDVSHALWLYWGQGADYSYSPKVLSSKFYN